MNNEKIPWTREQVRVLIYEFKKYTFMYLDSSTIIKRNTREAAWESIQKVVNQKRPGTSVDDVKRKYKYLRSSFMATYRKRKFSEEKHFERNNNLWYYNDMMFLKEEDTESISPQRQITGPSYQASRFVEATRDANNPQNIRFVNLSRPRESIPNFSVSERQPERHELGYDDTEENDVGIDPTFALETHMSSQDEGLLFSSPSMFNPSQELPTTSTAPVPPARMTASVNNVVRDQSTSGVSTETQTEASITIRKDSEMTQHRTNPDLFTDFIKGKLCGLNDDLRNTVEAGILATMYKLLPPTQTQ